MAKGREMLRCGTQLIHLARPSLSVAMRRGRKNQALAHSNVRLYPRVFVRVGVSIGVTCRGRCGGLGIFQDAMIADTPPDDMRLSRPDLGAIVEGSAPVGRPAHLEDAGMALHALNP